MTRIRAEQKGLTVVYDKTDDLPGMVIGDETHLRQILLNLLGNAVKFTEKGAVTLKISRFEPVQRQVERFEILDLKEGGQSKICNLKFQIKDTGIGIASDKLREIFDPFQQVANQRFKSEGTGLGLAISRHLIEIMGSQLHVNSAPGQGSVFWFDLELPLAPGAQIVKESRQRPTIIGFKGEARRILLVDDNAENRLVLKEVLEPLGFTITEAAHGKEALERIRQEPPDAIVMDIIMPVMDGLEATREIRRAEEQKSRRANAHHPALSTQHPVIIGISASAFDQTREQSLEAGCDAFLTKPVQVDALFQCLQTHMNIEWIYEEISDLDVGISDLGHPPSTIHHPPSEIIPPPKEHLLTLLDAVTIGDIMAIREQIVCIERLDLQFKPFVTAVRQMANSFQIGAIQEFLDRYLPDEPYDEIS